MNTRLFRYPNQNLSPEARWLLLQWSRSSSFDQAFRCPLLELYGRLEMQPRHARAALHLLKKGRYVIGEPLRRGRGRPVSRHSISPEFHNGLEKLEAPVTAHQSEIESLCRHATKDRASPVGKSQNLMSGQERANRLTLATYWLLSVLLAHAETPGIVRGLSFRQLMAFTGMPEQRLERQLSKLNKLGIIAHHEPGMLRNPGEMHMCSVYTLNLSHPVLLGKDSVGFTVPLISRNKPGEVHFLSGFYETAVVAAKLIKNKRGILAGIEKKFSTNENETDSSAQAKNSGERKRCLNALQAYEVGVSTLLPRLQLSTAAASCFLTVHDLGMGPILKAHIQSYVTSLLANHWTDLKRGHGRPGKPISSVIATIQRDCSSLPPAQNNEDEPQSTSDFYALLYSLAFSVAAKLQGYLLAANEEAKCDLSTAAFSIDPPHQQKTKDWIVKVHFRDSGGVSHPPNLGCWPETASFCLPAELEALPPEITRELN